MTLILPADSGIPDSIDDGSDGASARQRSHRSDPARVTGT